MCLCEFTVFVDVHLVPQIFRLAVAFSWFGSDVENLTEAQTSRLGVTFGPVYNLQYSGEQCGYVCMFVCAVL